MTKTEYYRSLAEYYAASTFINKVDAVVMLEDMSDEWFWHQVLQHHRPARYEFVAGTKTSDEASVSTGCGQCLKYRGFLSKRFFVCMDSDLRYLNDENLSGRDGFVQTYTYSWENHCAYVERLKGLDVGFDFADFLRNLSGVVHKGLMFLMHNVKVGGTDFTSRTMRMCLSRQYQKGDEEENGRALIRQINERLEKAMNASVNYCSFDYEAVSSEFMEKGVTVENAYLYVRGHNLYNLLNSIGSKLYEGKEVLFEDAVLKAPISHYEYPEAEKVRADIGCINQL